jgi:hypothetical protein
MMDSRKIILSNAIRIGHILFAIFMVLAPFMATSPETLILHSQLVLFLALKWIIKEWECGFTLVEHKLRKIEKKECVMYNILNPLVDIHSYPNHGMIIMLTFVLGIISFARYELITKKYS